MPNLQARLATNAVTNAVTTRVASRGASPWFLRLLATFVLLLSTALASAADAVRCDQSLVGTGATFVEVLERCGEPEHEYARVDYRYPGYTVHLDEWTYAQGRNRFRRVLHFENGRLHDIELRSKPRHSRLSSRPSSRLSPRYE